MKNIEIKARYRDFAHARRCVAQLGGQFAGRMEQKDTYYHVASGRLKLRQIAGGDTYLVGYHRPDTAEVRESEYDIYPVEQPAMLHAVLASVLGVQVVVEKVRELYLIDNVRVHLDRVRGLGTFIEFEAVFGAEKHIAGAERLLARYLEIFKIDRSALVGESYQQLILAADTA